MKRIFVGIPLSKDLQERALEWESTTPSRFAVHPSFAGGEAPQSSRDAPTFAEATAGKPRSSPPFQGGVPREAVGGGVRWIEPKNLHVTLVPPWQSHEWKVESDKLQRVKVKAFEIAFDKIVFGPNQHEPKMIWAVGEGSRTINPSRLGKIPGRAEAEDLRLTIYNQLGQEPDPRPFKLHLTLARLLESGDFVQLYKIPTLMNSPENELGRPQKLNWRMRVEKFVLYESHLLPDGAEYEILQEYKLPNV